MNASSTLLATLPPTLSSGPVLAHTTGHSDLPPASGESFSNVMSNAQGAQDHVPPGDKSPEPPQPSVNPAKSSTLAAVMVHSQPARKPGASPTGGGQIVPLPKQAAAPAAPTPKTEIAKLPAAPSIQLEPNVPAPEVPVVKPKVEQEPRDTKDPRPVKASKDDSSAGETAKSPPGPQPELPVLPPAIALPLLAVVLPLAAPPAPRQKALESQIAPISDEAKAPPSSKTPTPARVAGQEINSSGQAPVSEASKKTADDPADQSRAVADAPAPKPKVIRPATAEVSPAVTPPPISPAKDAAKLLAPTAPPATGSTAPQVADGTGGALTSQRMNLAGKKNEIAGPTAQKMPTLPQKDGVSTKASGEAAAATVSEPDSSAPKTDAVNSNLVADWTARPGALVLEAGRQTASSATIDHTATQAERLGNMVQQQVVMIRQSGANNLAVSLKLDPQTELSLQLTSHNGQIEASVRWERGTMAGLANHWQDLQDSLARQNVQLLPLENKPVSRASAYPPLSDQNSSSAFKQPSQNPQKQGREARPPLPLAAGMIPTPVTRKATTAATSRQGWESWA